MAIRKKRPATETTQPAPAPPPSPWARAKEALEAFWGRSNGGHAAYAELETALRILPLDARSLRKLRLELPIAEAQGTTSARIARAAACLQILEDEKES